MSTVSQRRATEKSLNRQSDAHERQTAKTEVAGWDEQPLQRKSQPRKVA